MHTNALSRIFYSIVAAAGIGFNGAAVQNSQGEEVSAARDVAQQNTVQQLTHEDFENNVLKSPGLVAVKFGAPWCGPCVMVQPALEEFAAANRDVQVYEINIDELSDELKKEYNTKYGLDRIPYMVVFEEGEVVKKGMIPGKSEADLTKWVVGTKFNSIRSFEEYQKTVLESPVPVLLQVTSENAQKENNADEIINSIAIAAEGRVRVIQVKISESKSDLINPLFKILRDNDILKPDGGFRGLPAYVVFEKSHATATAYFSKEDPVSVEQLKSVVIQSRQNVAAAISAPAPAAQP